MKSFLFSKLTMSLVLAVLFFGIMPKAAYAAPNGLLRLNSSGSRVGQVQERLELLGYYEYTITSYFGPITRNAVLSFQRDNQLVTDGIVGPVTYGKLFKDSSNSEPAALPTVTLYRYGARGNVVREIQQKLHQLGYLSVNPTGYFGSLTQQAVRVYQRAQGLAVDGIVGSITYSSLMAGTQAVPVSRGNDRPANGLIPWFGGVENIFPRNSDALVTDIDTGISFAVRRTGGYNHADVETLTREDTNNLLAIYSGRWSWTRRAVIVEINGVRIAGSMAGMPHDYQRITGNGMNGHFDIHFLNSRTHGTNSVNRDHQDMVQKAAAYMTN